jgi:hypothetical protein
MTMKSTATPTPGFSYGHMLLPGELFRFFGGGQEGEAHVGVIAFLLEVVLDLVADDIGDLAGDILHHGIGLDVFRREDGLRGEQ